MKLTDTFLRSLKTTGSVQKYSDGGGLYLHVSHAGGKLWRMAYRFEGKQKTLSFGAYPAVSLKDARDKREEAKSKLAAGIDPGAQKKALKEAIKAEAENDFEAVAREWFNSRLESWTTSHSERLFRRLKKDLFPSIGGKCIASITAPELLEALRLVERRGAVDTAHRILQDCGQVFRYAIATGRAERNIAADLKDALKPAKGKHFPTITNPREIGVLLRAIDAYPGSLIIRAALQLAPYIFVRPGELRQAEWLEFDFDAAEWKIPAHKMKMKVVHVVPLSRQVLAILEELRQYTGHSRYLFPGFKSNDKPITDNALPVALKALGYEGKIVVHGFRSMASTLLNEQGVNRDWIERQLAHGERNGVRAAYNYAEYLPERRRMMQEWADYLDVLRAAKN